MDIDIKQKQQETMIWKKQRFPAKTVGINSVVELKYNSQLVTFNVYLNNPR